MIEVVGLGCRKGQITMEGAEAVAKAKHVFVKTAKTDTFAFFEGKEVSTMDDVYDSSENFDELDEKIVARLLAQKGRTVYCVNGSGYDDKSVALLASRTDVKVYPSVSRAVSAAGFTTGAVFISAYDFVGDRAFDYDASLPLVITDVDDRYIAQEGKLKLADLIGDEEKVFVSGKERIVAEIDFGKKFDYSTTIYCPPKDFTDKKRYGFQDVVELLYRLRGENGCPWDRAQTHESIRSNLVEEAYELVDAINNKDIDNMIEETGDVLLQAVFHGVIGEDCGEFDMRDATTALVKKLIGRHEHVFGDVVARTAEEGLAAWDRAKGKEKHYKSFADKMDKTSKSLPSLMRAYKIQKTAAKAGMDFASPEDAAEKLAEETKELFAASPEERENEGGDLLFAAVNVLRALKVEPEVALAKAVEKFCKRFCYVEKHCTKPMNECTSEELDALWRKAKDEDR